MMTGGHVSFEVMSAASQPPAVRRIHAASLLHAYAELTKLRVTSLIVMTAWRGYFLASRKTGVSSWNLGLFHALLGIGMVSSGTAALDEVMERDVDARMRRTASRPLPTGRMSLLHAVLATFRRKNTVSEALPVVYGQQ